jgi:hypothetical protein
VSLMPSCVDVSRLASEALDSGRPLGLHVRLHLSICAVCRRVLAQFAVLRHGASRPSGAGPSLSEDAKARLRRSLEENRGH